MTKIRVYTEDHPRFSRRWWLTQGRNLFWVAVISILIWIYADIEKSETWDYSAKIRLNTEQAGNLMLLSEDNKAGVTFKEVDVTFKVAGSSSNLYEFGRWLKSKAAILEHDVSVYGPSETPHVIRAEQVLQRAGGLEKFGLTVNTISPSVIEVKLDRRIRVSDIPVQFDYIGATLDADPVVSPQQVDIFVAESLWKIIQKLTDKPVLKTRQVDLRNEQTDKPLEVIPSIAGVAVEPETKTVQVAVRISQRIDTKSLRVAVGVVTPAGWGEDGTWAEYALVRKDPLEWRPQITVRGTKKDLDQLRPEDIQAHVVLGDEDKKPVASWLERKVVIRFREQLKLELVGGNPTVKFKLQKRSPAPP
ncbi:MAG: hypothetical protein SVT52_04715 [Planctomycetota bacterium]|nr:hypothetical protein [Planctomycetota bacterium]